MSESIFKSIGAKTNPYANMVGQIKEFSKTIQGDPQQMVQELLNTGKMSQQELNQYMAMAQNIMPYINGKV